MTWLPLKRFRDAGIPKLNNLRRAAAAGLRTPPTWWRRGADGLAPPPTDLGAGPIILRSASPTEDTHLTSNAGQLLSLIVEERDAYAESLRRVIDALPRSSDGSPRGAVFVQPLIRGPEAGVAFFDGFYYERARSAQSNQQLTAGSARGDVTRGYLERDEPWSQWLARVYAVFGEDAGGDRRIDVEYAVDADGFVLLQVRPALFPVQRNQLLTQANLKETFGDWPSPWTTSCLLDCGQDISFLIQLEPLVRRWGGEFAVEAADRAWVNLSFWFRWMDFIGMPRSFATAAMGGYVASPADRRFRLIRFLVTLPGYLWQTRLLFAKLFDARRQMRRLDARIEAARSVKELYDVSVACWVLGLHTALSIAGLTALLFNVRRTLRLPGRARVVTVQMMEDYRRLGALKTDAEREAGLDAWLARYGHRGPGESDVARPRFAEMREALKRDLLRAPAPPKVETPRREGLLGWLCRPFYWIDEWREWFRHESIRSWQRVRTLLLEEGARLVQAGELDAPDDVFWLRGRDLTAKTPLRTAVKTARARRAQAQRIEYPLTAKKDDIEHLLATLQCVEANREGRRVLSGIAVTSAVMEGRVRRADELIELLNGDGELGPETILVTPSLEPSWAVVFPRVGGVVAEVGGELSHASILLRESRKPALVDVTGACRALKTGDRVRLDGVRGVVELLDGEERS
jgi:pyruvate,water dikinase